MLRIVIVVLAVLELVWFFAYGDMPLQWEILLPPVGVSWFNILSALAVAVFAPLLALAAIALAATGRRLGVAIALLCVAPLVYWAPVIAFTVAIMIYGF
jgi:hypothetical protein